MPCSDGGFRNVEYIYRPDPKTEAMLCVALRFIEREGWMHKLKLTANWKEAGITYDNMQAWFANHKREDERRQAQEKREAERKAKKQQALKKLSAEEKKILGIFE